MLPSNCRAKNVFVSGPMLDAGSRGSVTLKVTGSPLRRRLVFIPRFSPPYGNLKVACIRRPFLSPQPTPCEVGGAGRTLKRIVTDPRSPQLAACGGGVGNQTQFSRLEPTTLKHYTKLDLSHQTAVGDRVLFMKNSIS